MNGVSHRIAGLIAAQGPITVAQFMTMALHDAEGGYYATRDPLGRDFTTAPEISQMFGEMLGLWCAAAWRDQGCPKNPMLVELGPGRGSLMADALRALRAQKALPDFCDGLDVVMVEASPVLRALQEKAMANAKVNVRWAGHFDDSMAQRPLFVLANEFFDALPIRQFVKTDRGWCERMVTQADGKLAFALAPLVTPPSLIPKADAPDGGVYEVSASSTALAGEIARVIAAKGGAGLFVDYGYGEAGGHGETLQAIGGGAFADVLAEAGAQDLSAHVDFAALADAARHNGAAVHGPLGQGAFLNALGMGARAQQLATANPNSAGDVQAALARLTSPTQMGDLFKALAIMPPSAPTPPGFA